MTTNIINSGFILTALTANSYTEDALDLETAHLPKHQYKKMVAGALLISTLSIGSYLLQDQYSYLALENDENFEEDLLFMSISSGFALNAAIKVFNDLSSLKDSPLHLPVTNQNWVKEGVIYLLSASALYLTGRVGLLCASSYKTKESLLAMSLLLTLGTTKTGSIFEDIFFQMPTITLLSVSGFIANYLVKSLGEELVYVRDAVTHEIDVAASIKFNEQMKKGLIDTIHVFALSVLFIKMTDMIVEKMTNIYQSTMLYEQEPQEAIAGQFIDVVVLENLE